MKLLKELNLTPVKKTVGRNPIVQRRESLIKGIDKQLSICESLISDNELLEIITLGERYLLGSG